MEKAVNAKSKEHQMAIVTGASSGIGLGIADGIRANTISPGVVDTPMHANDDHESLKKLHPIPRLVQISEIVDALLYLQSAPMVNGENIRIDGGAHAGAGW